ncbi:hypothetical protein Tco_0529082 [Tanacetum coccineum]
MHPQLSKFHPQYPSESRKKLPFQLERKVCSLESFVVLSLLRSFVATVEVSLPASTAAMSSVENANATENISLVQASVERCL